MDLDQNWQLAADPRDQEIEELIAAGLPSPLMPSPFMVAVDDEPKEFTGENPVIKQEIKEEPIDHHDESQLYQEQQEDEDVVVISGLKWASELLHTETHENGHKLDAQIE